MIVLHQWPKKCMHGNAKLDHALHPVSHTEHSFRSEMKTPRIAWNCSTPCSHSVAKDQAALLPTDQKPNKAAETAAKPKPAHNVPDTCRHTWNRTTPSRGKPEIKSKWTELGFMGGGGWDL